jgi:hypothetical protein
MYQIKNEKEYEKAEKEMEKLYLDLWSISSVDPKFTQTKERLQELIEATQKWSSSHK